MFCFLCGFVTGFDARVSFAVLLRARLELGRQCNVLVRRSPSRIKKKAQCG